MPAELVLPYLVLLVAYWRLLVTEAAWERHLEWMIYRANLAQQCEEEEGNAK